jgi:hypothetical protein
MDLIGPSTYMSICGNYYGLFSFDGYSRFTSVIFLDDKTEVKSLFTNFAKKVQMRSDSRKMVVCARLSLVQWFYTH